MSNYNRGDLGDVNTKSEMDMNVSVAPVQGDAVFGAQTEGTQYTTMGW